MDDALARLTRTVSDEIPLARAAGIRLESDGADQLIARAPFAPNRNLHGTVFGGSLYVVALVAGFAQTHWLLERAGVHATVVVQRADSQYHAPMKTELVARIAPIEADSRQRFIDTVAARGRGRLGLSIAIANGERVAYGFMGTFAARLADARNLHGAERS